MLKQTLVLSLAFVLKISQFTKRQNFNSKRKDQSRLKIKHYILFYYKPKKIELYKDKTIYEFIGIKIYKKYLPTTGDIVRKWRNIKQIQIGNTDKISELYNYEKKTRNYEWRHIIGAFIFIILTLTLDRKLTIFDWVFLPILNLYLNIYPIFLQRYNRIRIINALKNNGYSSPYET